MVFEQVAVVVGSIARRHSITAATVWPAMSAARGSGRSLRSEQKFVPTVMDAAVSAPPVERERKDVCCRECRGREIEVDGTIRAGRRVNTTDRAQAVTS
jgi:hypothetical protein